MKEIPELKMFTDLLTKLKDRNIAIPVECHDCPDRDECNPTSEQERPPVFASDLLEELSRKLDLPMILGMKIKMDTSLILSRQPSTVAERRLIQTIEEIVDRENAVFKEHLAHLIKDVLK